MNSFYLTKLKNIKILDVDNNFKQYHISQIFIDNYKCILIGLNKDQFILIRDLILLDLSALLLHTEDIVCLNDIPKYRHIVNNNALMMGYGVDQGGRRVGMVTDIGFNQYLEIDHLIVKPSWLYRILYEDLIIKISSIKQINHKERIIYIDNSIMLRLTFLSKKQITSI